MSSTEEVANTQTKDPPQPQTQSHSHAETQSGTLTQQLTVFSDDSLEFSGSQVGFSGSTFVFPPAMLSILAFLLSEIYAAWS